MQGLPKFINVDLHCDLLSYFLHPNQGNKEEIGCSLPYLLEGNVALQVMAIYTATEKGSEAKGLKQAEIFTDLLKNSDFYKFENQNTDILNFEKVAVVAAIENASGFCEESQNLDRGLKNLDNIIEKTGRIAYLTITHHTENRFGGGNNTAIGLKEDGKVLIDYISNLQIPIDLSHTNDKFAFDILHHIDRQNYKIPVLASHSNSRLIYSHNRNLPDELITEIIRRKGVIGINLIKDFVNPQHSDFIYQHIEHFLNLGAVDNLAYGADFFFDLAHPDKLRYPFFFEGYNNALVYNNINENLCKYYNEEIIQKISHGNALDFFQRTLK